MKQSKDVLTVLFSIDLILVRIVTMANNYFDTCSNGNGKKKYHPYPIKVLGGD